MTRAIDPANRIGMFQLLCDAGVARIRIDRPAARNAVPRAAWHDFALLAAGLPADARVLLIESAVPGSFCAGADLKEMAALATDPAGGEALRLAMAAACTAIERLEIPTIAVIGGGCFGAGLALAMACDMRIADAGARFAIPPARLGILYPSRDVARLMALVGPAQATLLLASGTAIDGPEAARIGLADRLAPDAALMADQLSQEIAANAPASVAMLTAMARGGMNAAAADAAFDRAFLAPAFATRIAATAPRGIVR